MRRSLSARIFILFTIALVPIGLVAIQQTAQVVREAQTLTERDILARTLAAVSAEQRVLRRAQGAALALGEAAVTIGEEDPECSAMMRRIVRARMEFVFAGFGRMDGVMRCLSSDGGPVDLTGLATWEDFRVNPRPVVSLNRQGAASQMPVLISAVPIEDETGTVVGFGAVSIPLALSETLLSEGIENVDLAMMDREGNILSSSTGLGNSAIFDRLGIVPGELDLDRAGRAFVMRDDEGVSSTVAVAPLTNDQLYVVGRWARDEFAANRPFFGITALAFPLIMWVTGLVVAFLALERLVLGHLRTLRRQLSRFSVEDHRPSYALLPGAPIELVQIANSYNTMVDRIVAEHAKLERAAQEKSILLREVHHRVKNNLQLIASILNMQLRHIESPEARQVLRRVQDRVMSLAMIHKLLYVDSNIQKVRADPLLSEIVNGILGVGVPDDLRLKADLFFAPVELDADQAVPLSLLVTEAVTNAMKYSGADETGEIRIDVTLSERDDEFVELSVTNSRGPRKLQPDEGDAGTGLGSRLIAAFASQLGGELRIEETADAYTLHVAFQKLESEPLLGHAAE